jgi:glycosyltransferase involved in cell wall biosynthesis
VVCVSSAARDAAVAAGVDPDRAVVAHIGVDPAPFGQSDPAAIEAIRRVAGTGVVVGAFSRLAPWKGQHVLLEALPLLPGAHAVVVGGPLFGENAYEAHLRSLARTLGIADRVHFLGQRDDVATLMQAVDVIVHSPTAPEPFGRVVVEAMLSGKPLVTVHGGGIPEIVRDGETALTVPRAEPEPIAAAVRALLADVPRARRIAAAARAHALARFTADVAAAEFERQVLAAVAS